MYDDKYYGGYDEAVDEQIYNFIESAPIDINYAGSDFVDAYIESAENYVMLEEFLLEGFADQLEEASKTKTKYKAKVGLGKYNKTGTEGVLDDHSSSGSETVSSSSTESKKSRHSNIVTRMFKAFLNIVQKVISKIKGFMSSFRLKLTKAIASGMQKLTSALNNHVNYDKIGDFTTSAYDFASNYVELIKKYEAPSTFSVASIASNPEASEKAVDEYKEAIKNKISDIKKELVVEEKVKINKANAKAFFNAKSKEVLKDLDKSYDTIMKSFDTIIKDLKKSEETLRKDVYKEQTDEDFKVIKQKLSVTNKAISALTAGKYKVVQGIASAALKVYKSAFGAAVKCIKGRVFNSESVEYYNADIDVL